MRIIRKFRYLTILLFLISCAFLSVNSISHADSSEYQLEVNAKANVVTVYKKVQGEWEPYRAMRCSTGLGSGENRTPTGTFYVKGRWDWGAMVGNVYARYCVHFYEDYLFHSVPYDIRYNKKSQPTEEFNKLGQDASHGCVRLSTMDAKWVYDHCDRGTKVVIYNSSNPGPLGKPPAIEVSTSRETYWDPTDPDSDNPYYKLKSPEIEISNSKKLIVDKGTSYSLLSGVTAKDPNTFQDLTDLITVYDVEWYSEDQDVYIDKSFSTSRLGTYRVTYRVKDPYSGTTKKTVKIKVANILPSPNITVENVDATGYPKISWDSVSTTARYEVYRSTSKNGSYTKLGTTSGTVFYNTANLIPGTRYYYKVKAIAGKSTEADSSYSTAVSRLCDLARPVISVENVASTGYPKITWSPVSHATRYEVYRSTRKNGTYTKLGSTSGTVFYNTANLSPGTRYYYKVEAVYAPNTYASSAYSAIVSRLCDLPSPVVTASNDPKTGKVKLSWNPIDGASKYRIYRSTNKNGTYDCMHTQTGTVYINTYSAVPGTRYYYKVVAIYAPNTYANSANSTTVSRLCDLPSPVVTASNDPKTGKVKLSWNPVDGASKYRIYRSTSKNGTYACMHTQTGTVYINTYSVVPDTKYYYKVKAVYSSNTYANSACSSVVSAKYIAL